MITFSKTNSRVPFVSRNRWRTTYASSDFCSVVCVNHAHDPEMPRGVGRQSVPGWELSALPVAVSNRNRNYPTSACKADANHLWIVWGRRRWRRIGELQQQFLGGTVRREDLRDLLRRGEELLLRPMWALCYLLRLCSEVIRQTCDDDMCNESHSKIFIRVAFPFAGSWKETARPVLYAEDWFVGWGNGSPRRFHAFFQHIWEYVCCVEGGLRKQSHHIWVSRQTLLDLTRDHWSGYAESHSPINFPVKSILTKERKGIWRIIILDLWTRRP